MDHGLCTTRCVNVPLHAWKLLEEPYRWEFAGYSKLPTGRVLSQTKLAMWDDDDLKYNGFLNTTVGLPAQLQPFWLDEATSNCSKLVLKHLRTPLSTSSRVHLLLITYLASFSFLIIITTCTIYLARHQCSETSSDTKQGLMSYGTSFAHFGHKSGQGGALCKLAPCTRSKVAI